MTYISQRLRELGHEPAQVGSPVATYVSTRRAGQLLFISGQISRGSDGVLQGCLGADISVEEGRKASEVAALNLLAQVEAALVGQDEVVLQVVRLGVFVAATPKFTEHSKVANGASDLLVAVLGEAGEHARTAVGVASLPSGAAVELDAIVLVGRRNG